MHLRLRLHLHLQTTVHRPRAPGRPSDVLLYAQETRRTVVVYTEPLA